MRVQVWPTLDLNPLGESKLFKFANLRKRLYSSTFKVRVQGFRPTVRAKYLYYTLNIFYRYNSVIYYGNFHQVLNVSEFSNLFDNLGVQIKGCFLNQINDEVTT